MDQLLNMNMAGMDFTYAIGLMAVFVGIFLLVAFFSNIVIDPIKQRKIRSRRIRGMKKEQEIRAQIFKAYQESGGSPVLSVMQKIIGLGKIETLQRSLLQADIYMNPGTFLALVGLLGCLSFTIAWKMNMGFYAWSIGASVGSLPLLFMRWKKRRKTAKFEKQMPEAMELLARSLKAGHTLPSTIEMVSHEISAPLGTEFRITFEEQRLGLSVTQAFRRMGDRVASQDLRYFITAILIQTETGGNLAEILDNIGQLIRERLKLKGKVQSLTAEGRFSALILIFLPIVTFLALLVINREYVMTLLIDPLGVKVLTVAIVSVIFGALVMKKMVVIKV